MLTMKEAREGFITALEAEIEVAQKDDIVFEYVPTQKLSKGSNGVYFGTLEEETQLFEGSTVRIEDHNGQMAQAEIVALEDFELVLATEMELELETTYKIKYNLAWLLEALLDWIQAINPEIPRPIAQGVVNPGSLFSSDLTFKPPVSPSLNEYQADAVIRALNNDLTFIWGPPGTGKSRTISELIVQYLIAGKSVLFISQSNIAVDIVTKQIVQSENRRIQQLKKKNLLLRSSYPKMQPIEQWDDVLPYEIALGKEPTLAFELEMLRKERKTLLQQSKQGENVASQLKVNGLKLERVRSSVREKVAELERGASFIATTVAKASVTNAIRARKFDAVVIDEASMMNVPSVFAALTLAQEHGVVAGDFYQLQPIKRSTVGKAKRWLGQSVFTSSGIRDAVMNGKQDDPCVAILKRQYRMANEISGIVNAMFYGGILEDAELVDRSLRPVGDLLGQSRLVLIDVRDLVKCKRDPHSYSRVNHELAKISSSVARGYMEKDIPVGIITPYRAQAKEIRRQFTKEELQEQVQVSTVHKFQGSEQEIIIFEVADSFPQKKPSQLISGSKETFLDPEKNSSTLPLINVALTRAKSQIILVADLDYLLGRLSSTSILRQAINHFQEKGLVINYATGERLVPKKRVARKVTNQAEKEAASSFDQEKARAFLKCANGHKLVVKQNQYGGFFLGCSNYPYCKNDQSLTEDNLISILAILQPKCPKCSGEVWGELRKKWPFLKCAVCEFQLDKQQVKEIMLQYS